jgi:methionine biosynthesis protein MetW
LSSPDDHSRGFLNRPVDPLRYDGNDIIDPTDPFDVAGILRSFLPDGVQVLDVGCGTGALTNLVNQGKRNRVFGIEPDEKRAELAKTRGIDVSRGSLTEEYFKGREKFDVIIFADVLEHVPEPAALLRVASKGLKQNGLVLVSVPNVAHWSMRFDLMRGQFNYEATGIRDATHLRWFTLKTIQDLLRSQGFEVLACRQTAGTWLPEYKRIPWRWIPWRIRLRLIREMTRAVPTLFGCQHVLQARLIAL